MANSSLVKTILYKSLAEGVFKDVVTRSSSYYYFLGKTLSWEDDTKPPYPIDSFEYERDVRNEFITIKEIRPSDVAFVIPRKDWVADVVYDMYDDQYSDQVIGINVISGGSGYIDLYDTEITITGGGGTGATAVVSETVGGAVAGVVLTNRGSGYTSHPTLTITSPSGSGAQLEATMGIAPSGSQKLEESNFYVVTDDYNVYKCLDNNNNTRSVNKPSGTQLDPIKTLDGYIWKFMYNIPINLRNKFYTDEFIPVVSALTNHFYSNGTVDNIFIANKGKDYTSAVVSVSGDGYRESDPIYINGVQVVQSGTAYVNPSIEFSAPFGAASPYSPNIAVNLGQTIFNPDTYDYYEVVTPGTVSAVGPTHRSGTVLNGTSALKFVGSKIRGTVTTVNPKNITRIDLNQPGSSYKTPPTVTITDPTGVDAEAVAVIGKSTIVNTTIVNGGNGYVSPLLTVSGGGGTGAILQAIVVDGHINNVVVVNAGQDYVTQPTILIEDSYGTGASITAVLSGSPILSINVTDGGSNYTDPEVTITGGGGAGASATATVETGTIDEVILSGSIRDIVILNSGSGYITPPEVVLNGGGGNYAVVKSKLYADKVISTYIINHGDDYTSAPDVVFGTQWTQGSDVNTNTQYFNGNNLYTVINNGIMGSAPPIHTNVIDIVVASDVWEANTPVDTSLSGTVNVISDSTTITGDSTQFQSELSVGQIIIINDTDYVIAKIASDTTMYIASQYSGITETGLTATAKKTLYFEDRLYAVVGSGLTGADAPTHTTGTETNGDVDLVYLGTPASLRRDGTVASGYSILRYGAGYSVTPTATFTDVTGEGAELNFYTSKSEAKISAITEDGQLVYLVIDDPGVGYTKAALTVSGEGEGAALIADLSLGAISSQQANNEILTPAGTIDAISIVSGGYSYGVANISIEGDGTGATAEAVIDPLTNAIIKINITNRGQDYTYANVKVIGNGNGARLRAIISPYGGHGKNSPEELYARSLMFYTNISTDLNQGVTVGNDYRQVGIVKNPRVFDGFEKFQGSIGSACYIVQSPINTQRFIKDDDLYIERITTPQLQWEASLNMIIGDFVWYEDRIYTVVVSGIAGSTPPTTTSGSEVNGLAVVTYVGSTKSKKRYRIVSVSTTSALLQSLDNDIPEANDVFIKTSSITDNFTAVSVGLPSFDKYSGQLMYIDNKQGFTPSGDETITLRTIIRF